MNPNLRTIETDSKGKTRKREFCVMSKEDAYSILEGLAEIHNCKDKLKLIEPTISEQVDEEVAEEIEREIGKKNYSHPIKLDEYLGGKNNNLIKIYKQLQKEVYTLFDVEIYVLPQYIGWRKNGKYFAEIHIQQNNIRIQTLIPNKEYNIGEKLPDKYLWVLNYRFYIDNKDQLSDAKEILFDSYNKK